MAYWQCPTLWGGCPTLLRLYGGVKQYQKGRQRLEILQTGQRAHRHHAARHGSKEKYLGRMPLPKHIEASSGERLGSVVSSPAESGAKPRQETHFGIV